MKHRLSTIACLYILLSAHHAASGANPRPETGPDRISVEATVNDDELSFWDVPHRKEAFIELSPTKRGDGVTVGTLGVDGGDRDAIVKLAREIADDKHGSFDSLLIAYRNKLVFESYYLRGRVNLTHPQVSATKTYTSLAVGRAIQLGYLSMDDLEKPLVAFLKGLNPKRFVAGAEKITLHMAMTMRSGIRLSEEQAEALQKPSKKLRGRGLVQAYLEKSAPITSKSQVFNYQGSDPSLVMQVVDAVVPGTAEDFIRTELFEKLGITTYSWQRDVSGLPSGGDRASVTSRAMVKLGALVMNEGRWAGEQLISKAFIAKSLERVLHTGDDDIFGGGKDVSKQGYGYFWWSGDVKHGDQRFFVSSAQGGGGQFIILIGDLDLLVIATAHEGEVATLQMVAERILPAFLEKER